MKKVKSLLLRIPCQITELNLSITLQNGQSFRWQEASPGVWRGMIRDEVWSFAQDDANLYCVLHNLQLSGEFTCETGPAIANVSSNKKSSKNLLGESSSNCSSNEGGSRRQKRNRQLNEPSAVEKSIKNLVTCSVKKECTDSTESCNISSPSSRKNKKLKIIENSAVKYVGGYNAILKSSFSETISQSLLSSLLDKDQSLGSQSNTSPDVRNYFLDVVHQYFHLDVDLTTAYKDWCLRDVNFKAAAQKCPGVRLLDQPPVENVFSFICSSNNNISRISSLVEKLCVEFGSEECEVDGHKWFSFPSIEALAGDGVEEKLRALGFGYRAAYIHQSARALLAKGGESWLLALREASHEECRKQLRTLPGVGPKVADCISLMSLDKLESIPVDTHVYQIAARHYLPHLRQTKTVTQRVYDTITRHFQQLYGHRAGWAHSVLFSADLKKFAAH